MNPAEPCARIRRDQVAHPNGCRPELDTPKRKNQAKDSKAQSSLALAGFPDASAIPYTIACPS